MRGQAAQDTQPAPANDPNSFIDSAAARDVRSLRESADQSRLMAFAGLALGAAALVLAMKGAAGKRNSVNTACAPRCLSRRRGTAHPNSPGSRA